MKLIRLRRFGHLALVAALLLCAHRAFAAKLTSSGELDFAYGADVQAAGGEATSSKPESKLFYTEDELWWAVLGTDGGSSKGVYMYGLNASHDWREVLKLAGADPWARRTRSMKMAPCTSHCATTAR